MRILCLPCAFVILAELIIAGPTDPPSWSNAAESFTKTSSQCNKITALSASSGDGSTVIYSLASQTPVGGFSVGTDGFGDKILNCNQASITTASYEVVVRATHDGGNAKFADVTITITFSDQVTGPTWTSGDSFSLDKSDCTCCDSAAILSASSSDSTSVAYSLVSQTPDGGFSISSITLSCTYASIAPPSHTVVVRAQNTGNSGSTDQTFTFAVTAASGGGPTWSTGTSHTVNTNVNTDCSPAVTLSATTSDCSSVTYSFVSESSSGGFSVTGSDLSCTIASLTESSYTVVVRATNTGNSATTDLTLTITVTSGGSEGSNTGNSSSGNNRWKYIAGFIAGFGGLAVLLVGGFAAYKVLTLKTLKTVNPLKNKVNLKNDRETTILNTDEKADNTLHTEADTV